MEEKKKQYEKPTAQMIRFMYRDQVVAASGGKCSNIGMVSPMGEAINCKKEWNNEPWY